MTELSKRPTGPGSKFYASLWLPAAVLGALLIATLAVQVLLSWKAYQHLTPMTQFVAQMVKLQGANLELQRELVQSLRVDGQFTTIERERLREELKAILDMQAHLERKTPLSLTAAHQALADTTLQPKEALILALSHTRQAIDLERRAQQQLLDDVNRTTLLELKIGGIMLLVLPAGVILLVYLLRHRILAPLDRLSFLMTLLMRSDYSPAPVAAIDPVLRPLTENYNAMVARLAELEKEHAMREQILEGEVQTATHTLLEQQRTLANTERLAAVGETMARIAHELRNPLAGVKLACANLRQELSEPPLQPEFHERMDVVAVEIDRIIAVLNSLLDQSRHKPEPLHEVAVAQAVADLVTLLRYQLPANIRLEQRIARDIVCYLPDVLLRQALLNLVLNARQAIGEQAGTITIDAVVNNDKLRVRVCDDGPGFPSDLLECGIRAFVSHRPEGTGLGLSMVQRFAHDHGGSLSLTNVESHGACVVLEFPYRKNNV